MNGIEPEAVKEAEHQHSMGNSVVWRDRYCCTWFRAGVRDASGKWIGQINVHGEFVPNLSSKDTQ